MELQRRNPRRPTREPNLPCSVFTTTFQPPVFSLAALESVAGACILGSCSPQAGAIVQAPPVEQTFAVPEVAHVRRDPGRRISTCFGTNVRSATSMSNAMPPNGSRPFPLHRRSLPFFRLPVTSLNPFLPARHSPTPGRHSPTMPMTMSMTSDHSRKGTPICPLPHAPGF